MPKCSNFGILAKKKMVYHIFAKIFQCLSTSKIITALKTYISAIFGQVSTDI